MKTTLTAVLRHKGGLVARWEVESQGEILCLYDGSPAVRIMRDHTVAHFEPVTDEIGRKMCYFLENGLHWIQLPDFQPQGVAVISEDTIYNIQRSPWLGNHGTA